MLIAMTAGTAISVACVVACPPESEGSKFVVPQGGIFEVRLDDPAPGTIDCMGTPAPRGQVSMSEAPYAEQFTDAMLNKVWVTVKEGATLKEFCAAVGQGAEREVFVDWDRLKEGGLTPETTIAVPIKHVGIEPALRIVNERLGVSGKLAARRTGELVEISTQRTFDRREMQTTAYDLKAVLAGSAEGEARKQRLHEITSAMVGTIDPEGWTDNGGDTSRQSFSEGKLFVVAPPRVQKMVAWFFGQVGGAPVAGAEALHRGEPVQVLQVEPVKVNVLEERKRALDEQLRHGRRELAWKRVALGVELTDEDRAAMDDDRAVRAVGQDDARRAVVESEAKQLSVMVRTLQAELERVKAAHPGWRDATQGSGDYRSFK